MRNLLKGQGNEISWLEALALTAFWFVVASLAEAIVMVVLFGSHSLWRIYVMADRGVDFLAYVIIGAWIVVIGHLAVVIIAGLLHRSWKIVLLYVGIPVCTGIALFLWISAGIGNMMAA
jgi:hypothetical protein